MFALRVGSCSFLRSSTSKYIGPRCLAMVQATETTSTKPGEDFWQKNQRLSRPMSPHLTIYKPQLTSMLSISHRGTGLAMSALLSGFGIGMLALPCTYPYYLGLVANMAIGPAIIYSTKFIIAFPFWFHGFNGVRHLVWDLGYGFTLRTLYQSGWVVVSLATLTTAITAYL